MSKALAVIAVAAVATGTYWHFSPYVAVYSMRAAAEAHDADRLNAYIDYPKLRDSLKREMTAQMATELAGRDASGTAKAGAALGAMLGMVLVDGFVDAMVQPEFVMRVMNEARIKQASENPGQGGSRTARGVEWSLSHKTTDLVVVRGIGPDGGDPVSIVLERSGFADWRMTGIRLPD